MNVTLSALNAKPNLMIGNKVPKQIPPGRKGGPKDEAQLFTTSHLATRTTEGQKSFSAEINMQTGVFVNDGQDGRSARSLRPPLYRSPFPYKCTPVKLQVADHLKGGPLTARVQIMSGPWCIPFRYHVVSGPLSTRFRCTASSRSEQGNDKQAKQQRQPIETPM